MNKQDLTLLTDLYELTMMQGYYKKGQHETVVFDVFYRHNPCGNGYSVCAGLDQVIDYIKNLNFTYEDVDYLRSLHIFDDDFLQYLSGFHFTGDIYAIPEGSVVFPKEHCLRSLLRSWSSACRDDYPESDQSPVSHRYEDFPCCLCRRRRRNHGVRTAPCTGTGCRTLRSTCRYDRRMCRYVKCTGRSAF